ncbi:hypothetical protein CEXT_178711 [Caerostris extrusa]|uniref:Uncharacterized protein n=1 Tax=Caerostris extrusa TaxID=172846 RepID=A0AAV4S1C3_CAEEX|nr:hypothetical protein CEXT_178711 [Caerostris extrusa]
MFLRKSQPEESEQKEFFIRNVVVEQVHPESVHPVSTHSDSSEALEDHNKSLLWKVCFASAGRMKNDLRLKYPVSGNSSDLFFLYQ